MDCVVSPVDHRYVPMLVVDKVTLLPWQNVVGPLALIVGVAGVGFTTTSVEPDAEVQPLTVTVTEYVPAAATVAGRVGF
jgi:hypothetical protein